MEKLFNDEKMYTYIKGYAQGRHMFETLSALAYARRKHEGQLRKNGEAYFIHPLTMACHALAIGIKDDVVIASILLHDVCEDCGCTKAQLPVGEKVQDTVFLLTFQVQSGESKASAKKRYYQNIGQSKYASISKLLDRCHNVSDMAETFTKEKLNAYIEETKEYVLPLYRQAKNLYPEYSDYLFILKYHIVSMVNSIEAILKSV